MTTRPTFTMPAPVSAVPPASVARRRRRVSAAAISGKKGAARLARAALSDPEPAVRGTALSALRRLGSLDRATLAAAVGDPAPAVRARAAELAAGTAGAAALLIDLLGDPAAEVVEAACFGLGELGADAAPAVSALSRVAVGHPDPLARESAVAALGAIGQRSGLEAVLAAMTDKPAIRRRAILALAAFDGPEVERALEKGLSDRDWQVRQAAEDLTGRRR